MPRIVIVTGIFPPDAGGPAYYASALEKSLGLITNTKVIYFKHERNLVIGLRHLVYFSKVCVALMNADVVIAMDTFSVGLPAVLASKLMGKKILIRTGGDFLWEQYINRTKKKILLSEFYNQKLNLSIKEKIIFWLTRITLGMSDRIVFSTEWQRKIFIDTYKINPNKTKIIENAYPPKQTFVESRQKNFLWAGRSNFLKNKEMLKEVFKDIETERTDLSLNILDGVPREELFEYMKTCYAVILPSLSEISPNILLEVISFGKPFISTSDIGIRNKINNYGIFIDPRNKEELKGAILSLSDDMIYEQYKSAIKRADFKHSYEEIADEFMKIIETI